MPEEKMTGTMRHLLARAALAALLAACVGAPLPSVVQAAMSRCCSRLPRVVMSSRWAVR